MEVLDVPLIGATVTLKATFPSDAGDLATLTDITVKIYDDQRQIVESITGADILKTGFADYQADYTVSGVRYPQGDLFYEFSGRLGEDGKRILLGRKPLGRRWV